MKKTLYLVFRYFLIIILSLNSLYLVYALFTPITSYLSYLALKTVYNASIIGSTIIINNKSIALIDACIAGSAYFLLALLNLSTPDIKKRFLVLGFEWICFLAANTLRIVVLSVLFVKESDYFSKAHILSWYFLSALFVIAIWIITIKIFKIQKIPFYSDSLYLKKLIKK